MRISSFSLPSFLRPVQPVTSRILMVAIPVISILALFIFCSFRSFPSNREQLEALVNRFKSPNGFTVERRWSDETKEEKHDYIQRWFPTDEQSTMGDHTAPYFMLGDEGLLKEMRTDPTAQGNLFENFKCILQFWSFLFDERTLQITPKPEFENGFFITKPHNQARATRVLQSLILLGRPDLANSLYQALIDIPKLSDFTKDHYHWATGHGEDPGKKRRPRQRRLEELLPAAPHLAAAAAPS